MSPRAIGVVISMPNGIASAPTPPMPGVWVSAPTTNMPGATRPRSTTSGWVMPSPSNRWPTRVSTASFRVRRFALGAGLAVHRHLLVDDDRDPLGAGELGDADVAQPLDVGRERHLGDGDEVGPGPDDLAFLDALPTARARQDLLHQGLRHGRYSLRDRTSFSNAACLSAPSRAVSSGSGIIASGAAPSCPARAASPGIVRCSLTIAWINVIG
jgi:hypothetical protein